MATLEDAMCLVASAQKHQGVGLKINEFSDLIFGSDLAFNVDFKSIRAPTEL